MYYVLDQAVIRLPVQSVYIFLRQADFTKYIVSINVNKFMVCN